MSAENFKALFDNPAFTHWYKEELKAKDPSNTSFIGVGREESKSFIGKSVGDFIISKEQLSTIFTAEVANNLISTAKNDLDFHDIVSYRNVSGQEQLIFPEVKFSTLNKTIEKNLVALGNITNETNIHGKVAAYFDTTEVDIGHVFGFSNTLLIRAKESARSSIIAEAKRKLASSECIGEAAGIIEAKKFLEDSLLQLTALDSFIDSLVDVLADYDIATSDIKGLDLEINSKYKKARNTDGSYTWLFEWQGRTNNQTAGSSVAGTLGRIKQTKVGGTGIRGLFSTGITNPNLVKDTLASFVTDYIDKSIKAPDLDKLNLLQQKGSPSFLDHITDGICNILGNKPTLNNIYIGNVKLKPIPLLRVSKPKKLVAEANNLKVLKAKIATQTAKVKAQVTKFKTIRTTQGQFYSLASLQMLINEHLPHVLAANMGDGRRKDILNYRTGRFATSAKVERMSQSREGMITAFYSYMKNPYQTFEPEFDQGKPASRDPKLLIAKSIREIAAIKVGNKMRSVSI